MALGFSLRCAAPNAALIQLCLPDVGPALLADAALYHRRHSWTIRVLLLMPDHLHAVVAVGAGLRFADTIRNWKRLTARTRGVKWQRGFFDHRLRPGESLDLKCRYIRGNPVRAGLVSRAEDWLYFVDAASIEGR